MAGGTIVESQACLIGNRAALRDNADKREIARQVLELIEAQMRSRDYYSLTGNIQGDSPEAVARRVTYRPCGCHRVTQTTISKVYHKGGGDEGWYAATVVVRKQAAPGRNRRTAKAGAGDVSVAPLRYVFQEQRWSFEALLRQLADSHADDYVTTEFPAKARAPTSHRLPYRQDHTPEGARMIGPLIARYDDVDEARRELLRASHPGRRRCPGQSSPRFARSSARI